MKIPPLDSYSTRLPQLRQNRADLLVSISGLKSQCAIIRARLQDSPNPGNEVDRRLSAILGEIPAVVSLPDHKQLGVFQKELEILNAAVSAIDSEIQKESRYASSRMLEDVKPEIVRRGSEFAKAFLALRDKHLAFNEFTDLIEETGCSVSAIRIRPAGLSDPKDQCGSYPYGLREFAEAGYISHSVAPKVI
jgi:hypothetical protein